MKYIIIWILFYLGFPFVAHSQLGNTVLSSFPEVTLVIDTTQLKTKFYQNKNYFVFETKIISDSVILVAPESLPDGNYILFYSDSIYNTPAIIVIYNSNLKVKNVERYYYNGNIMYQVSYRSNKLDGTIVFYYPNGQVQNIDNYKKGRRSGKYILYYENGIKYYECLYRNNRKVGKEYKWDKNGVLIRLK